MSPKPAARDAASSRGSYLDIPPGWTRVSADGPGPFVTREVLRRPDGQEVVWSSRAHRKGRLPDRTGTWWRPDQVSWWIGVLFAIGATCFLVASVAAQWASASRPAIGLTYFIGSIFFTTAAYLQYWEAVNVERGPEGAPARHKRPASWEPRRIDWAASAIQLVGTVFFNVSTFAAMRKGFDTQQTNLRVWAPDVFGSICFLISSELAFAEVCKRWFGIQIRSLSWWIVAVNLAGSIAFGASALGAVIVPSTSDPLSATLANVGTAFGAVGVLVGAILLLPEAARSTRLSGPAGAQSTGG